MSEPTNLKREKRSFDEILADLTDLDKEYATDWEYTDIEYEVEKRTLPNELKGLSDDDNY